MFQFTLTLLPSNSVERQVKVLIKNLAIFFLCPSKHFLPISFQILLCGRPPQGLPEYRGGSFKETELSCLSSARLLRYSWLRFDLASADYPEAGVLKKFSLAGLAKRSWLRYSWLRVGLASADYHGLRVHYTIGQCIDSANSQLIPQISMKHLGLVERG